MLIDAFGPTERLYLGSLPVPEPGSDDVLVRVAYAGVNPADCKSRAGLVAPLRRHAFPMALGLDCSGVVERVGNNVSHIAPGDAVITMSSLLMGGNGTYAEYCVVPGHRVFRLPTGLSLAAGATIPIAGACAANAAFAAVEPRTGQKAFVNGGAGSVGTFLIQLLRESGVTVAATCSTRNIDYLRDLGVEKAIDYTVESIPRTLKQWAPDGLDLAWDLISNHTLPRDMAELVRAGGMLMCVETLVTGLEAFDLEAARRRGVRVIDDTHDTMTPDRRDYQMAPLRRLLGAIEDGRIVTPPYEILPLEDAAAAHERVATGHVRGKILLRVAGG